MGIKKLLIINGAAVLLLIIFAFSYKSVTDKKTDLRQESISAEEKSTTSDTVENTEAKQLAAAEMDTDETGSNSGETDSNKEEAEVITEEISSGINSLINKYYDLTKKFDNNLLIIDDTAKTKQLKELLNKKKELIASYKNLTTYIKPGPVKDTYIVFISYDIKLKNIKTLVPGMSVVTVKKVGANALKIDISKNSEINNSINRLMKEEDIKKVIAEVNAKLTEAVKKDKSLKKFVELLKKLS